MSGVGTETVSNTSDRCMCGHQRIAHRLPSRSVSDIRCSDPCGAQYLNTLGAWIRCACPGFRHEDS